MLFAKSSSSYFGNISKKFLSVMVPFAQKSNHRSIVRHCDTQINGKLCAEKLFARKCSTTTEESCSINQDFLTKMRTFSGSEGAFSGGEGAFSLVHNFEELLLKCGVIREVELSDRESLLTIKGDKWTFSAIAEGDCCSTSWFEPFAGTSFQDLVGKSVLSVKEERGVKCKHSRKQEVDKNDLWSVVLVDANDTIDNRPPAGTRKKRKKTNFKFYFRNSSNGYYRGWLYVWSSFATNTGDEYVPNADARVVFVLGLPGSGKTTFVERYFKTEELRGFNYENKDDCLFDPMYLQTAKARLNQGARLILNDPRFCEVDKFEQAFNQVLRNLVSVQQISIVSFENNPAQCMKNNEKNVYGRSRDCTSAYVTALSKKYAKTLKRISTFDKCVQHQVPVAVPHDSEP